MVTNLVAGKEDSKASNTLEPPLYSRVSGAGEPVILLHGLFGMGSNLGGLARAISDSFEVHQLDLPNHGRSPWQPQADLGSMAASVKRYADKEGLGSVSVVGHSLGGKVAMQFALSNPQRVTGLAVADIAPVAYAGSHDTVFEAIRAVDAERPQSRAQASDLMREFVPDHGVVSFLALSLQRDPQGAYVWRFNAQGLQDSYAEFRAPPVGPICRAQALFIYGLDSTYVDERGKAAASQLFPEAQFEGIAGTGHWLHAEKPHEFNTAVYEFLQRCSPGKDGQQ